LPSSISTPHTPKLSIFIPYYIHIFILSSGTRWRIRTPSIKFWKLIRSHPVSRTKTNCEVQSQQSNSLILERRLASVLCLLPPIVHLQRRRPGNTTSVGGGTVSEFFPYHRNPRLNPHSTCQINHPNYCQPPLTRVSQRAHIPLRQGSSL